MVCTGSNYGGSKWYVLSGQKRQQQQKKNEHILPCWFERYGILIRSFSIFIYLCAVVILGDGILQVHEIACELCGWHVSGRKKKKMTTATKKNSAQNGAHHDIIMHIKL